MREVVLWLVLVASLALVNAMLIGKERVLAHGQTMLLELAPRDPRSLLQGDYMTLRYRLANELRRALDEPGSADGRIVVALDENSVARFVRRDNGKPVKEGERLLQYRKRGDNVRLASDAFFFQEGRDELYRAARYGELRVDAEGDAVLVGLRNGQFRILGSEEN